MRFLVFCLVNLTFSATASAADHLTLWITDPIGMTNAIQCHLPESIFAKSSLPIIPPTLIEHDIIAWNPSNGRWTLNRSRFTHDDVYKKLHDHCFVLAINDKLISNGVVLSSHSARLTKIPTIRVFNQSSALDFQLTSGNHSGPIQLIHIEALDAVFK